MMLGIKKKNDNIFNEYFKQFKEKLTDNNIVYNPFNGKLYEVDELIVIAIKPVYPNLAVYFFPFAAIIYLLFGFSFIIYIMLGIGSLSFFWSHAFYKLMIKIGLHKKGYKLPIEFI